MSFRLPSDDEESADKLYSWNHFTNGELKNNHDDLLRAEVGLPEVSFVFQYISH